MWRIRKYFLAVVILVEAEAGLCAQSGAHAGQPGGSRRPSAREVAEIQPATEDPNNQAPLTATEDQNNHAPQSRKKEKISLEKHRLNVMQFIVEGEDTVFVGQQLPAARVYDRLPRQRGKDWRQYYRLVYNFSKVYPYALVAKSLVAEADSTITTDNLKRGKKEKYIDKLQKELFEAFEAPLRKLTVSQATLLIRLIERETGRPSYDIIKDYKTGAAAGFWQGIAKLCGTSLKLPYAPEGEDKETEELIQVWEAGEFDGIYFSLFGQFPEKPEIPSKYM